MGVRYYAGDSVIRQRTIEARWAAIRAEAEAAPTREAAKRAALYKGNYPHMRPGEILPLAAGGVDPMDPLARDVATRSAIRRKRRTGTFGAIRDFVEDADDYGVKALKRTTRETTALLAAPLEVAQGALRSTITSLPGQSGEVVGGAGVGATLGALVGTLGGPFAPITSTLGAAVGGAIGGALGAAAPEVTGTPQNPFAQSTLGQHLMEGKSLGEGYFGWGEARAAQEAVSRRAASIDGLGLTPGRLLFSGVVEPGSTPYSLMSGLVDASIAISRADPTGAAIRGLGQARRLGHLGGIPDFALQAQRRGAGLAEAHRRDLVPEVAREWLTESRLGQRMVTALAEETNFERIRAALPMADPGTQLAIRNASTEQGVLDALDPLLGLSITRPSRITSRFGDPSLGYGVRRRSGDTRFAAALGEGTGQGAARWSAAMPTGVIDFNRPAEALEEFNRLQLNVKVPLEARSASNQRLAEILTGDAPDAKLAANRLVFDTLITGDHGALVRRGTNPAMVERWAKRLTAWEEDQVRYFQRGAAGQDPPGAVLGGESMPLAPSSIFAGEADIVRFDRATVRDMRRASSKMKGLLTHKSWEMFAAGADTAMAAWRPLVLLRGAWTVRVIAEEQIRMAASGMSSMFAHPFSFIAMAAADDGTLAKTLAHLGRPGEAVAGRLGRGAGDIRGAEWSELPPDVQGMFRGALNDYSDTMGRAIQRDGWLRDGADPRRPNFVEGQGTTTYNRVGAMGEADVGFHGAQAEWLEILNRNPVASRFAAGESDDAVRDWFMRGEGAELRRKLIQEPGGAALSNTAGVNKLLASQKAEVLRAAGIKADPLNPTLLPPSAGNPKLLQAIARGELEGVPMKLPDGSLNPKFTEELRFQRTGPDQVTGAAIQPASVRERYDRKMDRFFDFFMGTPSVKMSRAPAFKQAYWRKMEDLMLMATREDQTQILAAARRWKMDTGTIGRLEKRAASGHGTHTVTELDAVGKRHALVTTKELLYDTANRGQLSDSLRLVFPFLEAQKEVMTRWAKLGTRAPQVLRRGQQTVDGARGAGFFYCVDDQTEALTRRGWCRHMELTDGDEFLTLDPATDTIVWARATRVSRFDYDGYLVRWDHGRIDALTTSAHRWLVEDWRVQYPPATNRRHRGAQGRNFKTTSQLSAAGFGGPGSRIIAGGGSPDCFAPWPVHSDEFVELVAWAITEGHYRHRTSKNDTAVVITQCPVANPEYVERLRLLAKHYQEFGATCSEYYSGDGTVRAFYFGKGVGSLIRAVAPDKAITAEFVCSLTVTQARLFMNTLMAGDGYVRRNGYRAWAQKDRGRVDGFQMLAAMLGERTYARPLPGGCSNISMYRTRYTQVSRHVVTSEAYVGVVWCPTVPTGTWFARRNGSTYWTGNTDTQTGEEMFAYPGSEFITEKMFGMKIKLGGRAAGLSFFGTGLMPGVGPAVQVPAGWLLTDRPETDGLRKLINPLGGGEAEDEKPEDVFGGLIGAFVPSWAKSGITALMGNEDDRAFGNMTIDVFRSGVTQGKWSVDTEDDIRDGLHKAKEIARGLYVLRMAGSLGGAPTTVTPEYMAKDPDGRWLLADIVRQDWQNLRDGVGTDAEGNPVDPDDADTAFVEKYGDKFGLYMQSYTTSTSGGPTTEAAGDWVRRNPALRDRHPSVYGFFAPQGAGEFDYQTYLRQLRSEERVALTPDQFVKKAQDKVGKMIYYNLAGRFGPYPTKPQREWLITVRERLREKIPGYDEHLTLPEKYDNDTLVADLRTAAESGDFGDSDTAEALRIYFRIHDIATAAATPAGLRTFTQARVARPLRDWVRNAGELLAREYPDFREAWDRVLEGELIDDGQDATEVQAVG